MPNASKRGQTWSIEHTLTHSRVITIVYTVTGTCNLHLQSSKYNHFSIQQDFEFKFESWNIFEFELYLFWAWTWFEQNGLEYFAKCHQQVWAPK